MSEQLNATIESEYEEQQQVNPSMSFHERMEIHLQNENTLSDSTLTPDSPTPPSEQPQDLGEKYNSIDVNSDLNCEDCAVKPLCNGEDEDHFIRTRMMEASKNTEMDAIEFDASEEGQALKAELKIEWQKLVIEIKTEELISTEADPKEIQDILSEFESQEYSPYDPVKGELILNSDGNWDLVIKGEDGKEYSPSASKSSAEKDEHGNAGSKELLTEMRNQLIENGYFKYESKELVTVYVREGTTVLIYSYEKAHTEAEPDDEEDQIHPNPGTAPTPELSSEEEPTAFDQQNAAILKASGIGIKVEARATNPQEKVVDKSEHYDEKHPSVKISDQEHSSLLKFLGIQREESTPTSETPTFLSSAQAVEYVEDFAIERTEMTQQTEAAPASDGEEISEEQEEQEAEEERTEEARSFSGAIEPSITTNAATAREIKADNSNEAASSQSDKVVAKETVRPGVAQEQSPVAITKPETSGPDAPEGPSLEPQIQRNEDGTESVVTVVKPVEQKTQTGQTQTTSETKIVSEQAYVERNDQGMAIEKTSQPRAESSSEAAHQEEVSIENISAEKRNEIAETAPPFEEIENQASAEETSEVESTEEVANAVELVTNEAEPTPTIEEIIAENRSQRNEQRVEQTKQAETAQINRISSAPITSSELNETKMRIQKQTEKTQDTLAALRQIRNAPRGTETLRQYQPGDQPAPIASTNSTTQEREEELLQLAA